MINSVRSLQHSGPRRGAGLVGGHYNLPPPLLPFSHLASFSQACPLPYYMQIQGKVRCRTCPVSSRNFHQMVLILPLSPCPTHPLLSLFLSMPHPPTSLSFSLLSPPSSLSPYTMISDRHFYHNNSINKKALYTDQVPGLMLRTGPVEVREQAPKPE